MQPKRSILFLNRFYWPEVAATGQMLTDLAEDWAENGWEVTVLTGRWSHVNGPKRLVAVEVRNGVRILRIGETRFRREGLIGRLGDSAAYIFGASLRLLRLPRPDVVVAMSDPPFLLAPVLAAGRLRGFPTVYWVQDLYPQLAARLGCLSETGVTYRVLSALARRLHARCDLVVALGPEMTRAVIDAGSRVERTVSIPNWADPTSIQPIARDRNPFLRRHRLDGKFVVLYSGNAGRAHTFDAIIGAMRGLREEPEIVFLFIGGGMQLPRIRAVVEDEGLTNCRFLDYLPREELSYSLSAASVSLVSENPDARGLVVPSKTYGILASGRPVLFVGDEHSDVARMIRQAECGIVVAPDEPAELVRELRDLRSDPARLERMGRNARNAAELVFSRSILTSLWRHTVTRLIEPREAGAWKTAVSSAA